MATIATRHAYRFGFLKSEEWQGHRKIILSERKTRCNICSKRSWENDVHHLRYRKGLYVKIRSDFQVLCRRCHSIVHFVLDHRKAMGAKDNHRRFWRNTRRSVVRINKRSRQVGLEIAMIEFRHIYSTLQKGKQ
jgi:5-methylcytosine-specific restriction endonuclease McrA